MRHEQPQALRRRLLVAGLSCVALTTFDVPAQQAGAFRLLVQELPPFAFNRRGIATGFVPEVLAALSQELGTPLPEIELTPLSRATDMLHDHHNVLFGPIARVPANERDFNWLGPLAHNRLRAFRRPGASPLPAGVAALKQARQIAVTRAGGHEALLHALGFNNLRLVRSQGDGLHELLAGEVDYCVVSELVIAPLMAELRLPASAVQDTGVALGEYDVYFAVSRDVDANLLERWQAAIERLRRSGRLEALARENFAVAMRP